MLHDQRTFRPDNKEDRQKTRLLIILKGDHPFLALKRREALMRKVTQLTVFVRPSVCPSVSTLSFERTDV